MPPRQQRLAVVDPLRGTVRAGLVVRPPQTVRAAFPNLPGQRVPIQARYTTPVAYQAAQVTPEMRANGIVANGRYYAAGALAPVPAAFQAATIADPGYQAQALAFSVAGEDMPTAAARANMTVNTRPETFAFRTVIRVGEPSEIAALSTYLQTIVRTNPAFFTDRQRRYRYQLEFERTYQDPTRIGIAEWYREARTLRSPIGRFMSANVSYLMDKLRALIEDYDQGNVVWLGNWRIVRYRVPQAFGRGGQLFRSLDNANRHYLWVHTPSRDNCLEIALALINAVRKRDTFDQLFAGAHAIHERQVLGITFKRAVSAQEALAELEGASTDEREHRKLAVYAKHLKAPIIAYNNVFSEVYRATPPVKRVRVANAEERLRPFRILLSGGHWYPLFPRSELPPAKLARLEALLCAHDAQSETQRYLERITVEAAMPTWYAGVRAENTAMHVAAEKDVRSVLSAATNLDELLRNDRAKPMDLSSFRAKHAEFDPTRLVAWDIETYVKEAFRVTEDNYDEYVQVEGVVQSRMGVRYFAQAYAVGISYLSEEGRALWGFLSDDARRAMQWPPDEWFVHKQFWGDDCLRQLLAFLSTHAEFFNRCTFWGWNSGHFDIIPLENEVHSTEYACPWAPLSSGCLESKGTWLSFALVHVGQPGSDTYATTRRVLEERSEDQRFDDSGLKVIYFKDGMKFIPGSLGDVTASFKVPHPKVGGVDHELIRSHNYLQYRGPIEHYLKHDCLGLWEVLWAFFREIWYSYGIDGTRAVTLPSLVMEIYYRHYYRPEFRFHVATRLMQLFVEEGYLGARTQCEYIGNAKASDFPLTGERPEEARIESYDVSSLYPWSSMEPRMPAGRPKWVTRWADVFDPATGRIRESFVGYVLVNVESTELATYDPAHYPRDPAHGLARIPLHACVMNQRLMFPLFERPTALVLFSEEIRYSQQLGLLYRYSTTRPDPTEVVALAYEPIPCYRMYHIECMERKEAASVAGNAVARELEKQKANLQYGRMGTEITREGVIVVESWRRTRANDLHNELLAKGCLVGVSNRMGANGYGTTFVRGWTDMKRRIDQINTAAATTSIARMRQYAIQRAFLESDPKAVIFYGDTDSTYTNARMTPELLRMFNRRYDYRREQWTEEVSPEGQAVGMLKAEAIELFKTKDERKRQTEWLAAQGLRNGYTRLTVAGPKFYGKITDTTFDGRPRSKTRCKGFSERMRVKDAPEFGQDEGDAVETSGHANAFEAMWALVEACVEQAAEGVPPEDMPRLANKQRQFRTGTANYVTETSHGWHIEVVDVEKRFLPQIATYRKGVRRPDGFVTPFVVDKTSDPVGRVKRRQPTTEEIAKFEEWMLSIEATAEELADDPDELAAAAFTM